MLRREHANNVTKRLLARQAKKHFENAYYIVEQRSRLATKHNKLKSQHRKTGDNWSTPGLALIIDAIFIPRTFRKKRLE